MRRILGNSSRDLELGLRPENFALTAPDTPGNVTGELMDIEPLGLKSALTVKNGQAEFRMLVDSAETLALTIGENIGVELANTNKMLCFNPETGQRL